MMDDDGWRDGRVGDVRAEHGGHDGRVTVYGGVKVKVVWKCRCRRAESE